MHQGGLCATLRCVCDWRRRYLLQALQHMLGEGGVSAVMAGMPEGQQHKLLTELLRRQALAWGPVGQTGGKGAARGRP